MTNEMKAKRLEEISACPLCMESGDTPLLRESAALWREWDGVRWEDSELCENCMAVYKGWLIRVDRSSVPTRWRVYDGDLLHVFLGKSADVDAAKAAAIAWVDAQEGK